MLPGFSMGERMDSIQSSVPSVVSYSCQVEPNNSRLLEEYRTISRALRCLRNSMSELSIKGGDLSSLERKLVDVKCYRGAEVYVRHSKKKGIYFDRHKSLLSRLRISDGGFAIASKQIAAMSPIFSTACLREKVNVGSFFDLTGEALRQNHMLYLECCKNIKLKQSALSFLSQRLEGCRVLPEVVEVKGVRGRAIVNRLLGCTRGCDYINNVARHQARQLGIKSGVKDCGRLPPQEILALVENELSRSVGREGRFYRFDCLTPQELSQFEGALASEQQVESVIFLALQSEQMILPNSLQGGLHPVLFSIEGKPGKAHMFNRGSRFKVQAIKAKGEQREIVLLEQQANDKPAVPVWR